MRIIYSVFISLIISTTAHSLPNNYVEFGFGATQFDLAKRLNTSSSSVKPSPAGKLLVAGRLNNNPYAWFETGYKYNGSFTDSSTDNQPTEIVSTKSKYTSHSLTFGLKLTTLPYNKFAAYARLGAGKNKIFLTENVNTTNRSNNSVVSTKMSENKSTSTYYGGAGFSFAVNHLSRLNFEYQQVNYSIEGVDLIDHSGFITYKMFIR